MIDRREVEQSKAFDVDYAEALIVFVLNKLGKRRPRYMNQWVYTLVGLAVEYRRQFNNKTVNEDVYIATFIIKTDNVEAVNISVNFLNWATVKMMMQPALPSQNKRHLRNIIVELLYHWDKTHRFERLGSRTAAASLPLFGQRGAGEQGASGTIGGWVITA